ncbi:HlyD family efflux transporter periplasmic adaptor subunit [Treponema sp. J25]|uniref:HlyD family secretion protein n=1 Tax=Treponema sp. J25 TaxID=2094121 RepID=UPI001404E7B9|nr:HlyD family efflux transporter periplasmic adaptor subunit [Treponema sp. J25]
MIKFGDLSNYKYGRDFFEQKIPWVSTYFIGIVGIIVVTTIIWACLGSIDIVIKAPASLCYQDYTSIIKNPVAGVLQERCYINGSKVGKGDLLFRINTETLMVDYTSTVTAIKRSEEELRNLLLFERAVKAGTNLVSPLYEQAYARAALYFADKRSLELNLKKATNAFEAEQRLPSEMVAAKRIKDLEIERDLAQANLDAFTPRQLLTLEQEKEQVTEKLEALHKHLSIVNKQIQDSQVRAPISGTVEELKKINQGDFLFEGEELLRIVPENSKFLTAEISIASRDMADIRPGMAVSLRLNALPPAEYGEIKGTVCSVSADALYLNTGAAYFLVKALLPQQYVMNRRGLAIPLKAGMSGEGRIITEQKRIIRYILEKLDFI